MVVTWSGITSRLEIYVCVFILMPFSPLHLGLFYLRAISQFRHGFHRIYVFVCQDSVAECNRSSSNLKKIALCQDFQNPQRFLWINLLLRIIERLGLEGTPRIKFQPPCHSQGHKPPDFVLDQLPRGPSNLVLISRDRTSTTSIM